MKKLCALLAALLTIAAVSGCNGSAKPAETSPAETSGSETSASVTESTEAPETSGTTASEATANTSEENEENENKMISFDDIKDKAPHLYELSKYIVAEKSTVSLETLDDSFNVTCVTNYYINNQYGIRVSVKNADADAPSDVMLKNAYYYIVSHNQKKAFEVEPGYSMLVAIDDELRRKTFGINIKLKSLDIKTGEEELNGVMYDTETVSDGEVTSVYYVNKETDEIEYMRISAGLIRITDRKLDVAEDAFDIPEDYELVQAVETTE